MPRVTVIAALVVLVLLSFAAPSAPAQDGLAAQPEELWKEFPLDSEKQQPPKPEAQKSPPPESEVEQTAPQAQASESERTTAEARGDSGDGLGLWLLPVLGLLAFLAGVVAAKAALRVTRRRRQTARELPAPTEQPAGKPQAELSTGGRVEPATELAATASTRTTAPKDADHPVRAKPSAPLEREKPKPLKSPAPVVAGRPAPVKEPKPSPVKEPKPAPVAEHKPAPVAEHKPAPVAEHKPAPVKDDKHAPGVAVPPATVGEKKPRPVKEHEPPPVEVEKPAPALTKEPSPTKKEEPAPAPAPPKDQTPRPALAEQSKPPSRPSPPAEDQKPRPEQKPKLKAVAPAPPKESRTLPDDVLPFPTRADRIGRRSGASSTPARALGYVSAADTDAHVSDLEAQTDEIRKACVRNGFESVEVVRDFESHSGSDLERPGLIYAIERLEAGEASCLVVTSLERLTMSAAHLGTLIDRLGESRIRLVVLDIQLDTGNPDGQLAAEALANVGTLERKSLDTRTRKGLEAARDARRSSGRPAVADRPALKERIGDMRARGMTLQAIADTLNSEGVPTLRGGSEWRPSSVQAAVGYKRPKRGARKSANGRAGGTPDPQVSGASGGSAPADDR